jgi:phosphoenolpyruvate-protein kinase (PTS system EI component)
LHRTLSEGEVAAEMRSLPMRITPEDMASWGGDVPGAPGSLWPRFVEAVERALRREGGGLEFAVATVLGWFREGIDLRVTRDMPGQLQRLDDLAQEVLSTLVSGRNKAAREESSYVALASTLTLAEAMNLEAGVAGLAVGVGSDSQVAGAARLLGVPGILGIPKVCEVAREGDVVRLDGASGTLDVVARVGTGAP